MIIMLHHSVGRTLVWRHAPARTVSSRPDGRGVLPLQAADQEHPPGAWAAQQAAQARWRCSPCPATITQLHPPQPRLQRCDALGMRRRAAPPTDEPVAEHVVQPLQDGQLEQQQLLYEHMAESGPGVLHNHMQTIRFLTTGACYAAIAVAGIMWTRFMYMQRHLLLPKGSEPTVVTDATSSSAVDSGASKSSSSTAALASAAIARQSVGGSMGDSMEAPAAAAAAPAAGSAAFGARHFAASSRTGLTKGWWQALPQLHYVDFGKDGLVPHIPLVPGKKQTTLIAFEDAADAHFVAQTLLANALESMGASGTKRKPQVTAATPAMMQLMARNIGVSLDVLPCNLLQHSTRLGIQELHIVLREALVAAATSTPLAVRRQQQQQPPPPPPPPQQQQQQPLQREASSSQATTVQDAATTASFQPVVTAMPTTPMQRRLQDFPGFDDPPEAANSTTGSPPAPGASTAMSDAQEVQTSTVPLTATVSDMEGVSISDMQTLAASKTTQTSAAAVGGSIGHSETSESINSTSKDTVGESSDEHGAAGSGVAEFPAAPSTATSTSAEPSASPVIDAPAAAPPVPEPASAAAPAAPAGDTRTAATSVQNALAQGPTDAALKQAAQQLLTPAGPTWEAVEEDLMAEYYQLMQLEEDEDEEEEAEEAQQQGVGQHQQQVTAQAAQAVVADAVLLPDVHASTRTGDSQRATSGQRASTSSRPQYVAGTVAQSRQQQHDRQAKQAVQDVWASDMVEPPPSGSSSTSSSRSNTQGNSSNVGSGSAEERMQRGLDALDERLQQLASAGGSSGGSPGLAGSTSGRNGSSTATPLDKLTQELGELESQMVSYIGQLDVQQLADMGLVSEQGTISRESGLQLIDKLQGLVNNLKAMQNQVQQVAALKGVELPSDMPRMSDRIRQALDNDPRLNDTTPQADGNTMSQQHSGNVKGASTTNGQGSSSSSSSSSSGSNTGSGISSSHIGSEGAVVEVQPLQQPPVSSSESVGSSSQRSNGGRPARSWGAWGGNERIRRANTTVVQSQEHSGARATSNGKSSSSSDTSSVSSGSSTNSMPGYDSSPTEHGSSHSGRASSAASEHHEPGTVRTSDGAVIVSKSIGKQRPRRVQRSAEERQATVASALKAAAEAPVDAESSDDEGDATSSSVLQGMPGLVGGAKQGGKRKWWQERFQALMLPTFRYADGSTGYVSMDVSLNPERRDVRVITFEDRHDCMHCIAIMQAWPQYSDARLSLAMVATHSLEQEVIQRPENGTSPPAGIVVFRRGKLPMRVGMSLEEFTQVVLYQAAAQLSLSKIGYSFDDY